MPKNGHLDISTLVDWDGRGNYLTPEAARQFIAWRLAVFQETGLWMFTSEAYRPEGHPGDLAAGNYNTQWYWWEWYDGDSRFAARPGTSSKHGLAEAVDIISTVYGNDGNSDVHRKIERLGRLYGWAFNVAGEPWHAGYIGSPLIVASGLDVRPFEAPPTPKEFGNMRFNYDNEGRAWLRTDKGFTGQPTDNPEILGYLERYVNKTGYQVFTSAELDEIARHIDSVNSGGAMQYKGKRPDGI